MSDIREQIVDEFCRRLAASPEFPAATVQQLRELLRTSGKPKPADVMKILNTTPPDEMP